MKRELRPCLREIIRVAPHAGAWIETNAEAYGGLGQLVAPHAGAWIETSWVRASPLLRRVAHHAGAWIETFGITSILWSFSVAPHAGAWIETDECFPATSRGESPPTRGRGLKHAASRLD